ncbi:MAG: hypothetical protein ACI4N3_00820 [Alphaproteobacteria bacterium]
MKNIFSEKLLSVLGLFLLSGMVVLSISLPVSSQTKRTVARKTTGTSSSNRKTTKAKVSSSSSKTVKSSPATSTSKNVRKTTTTVKKRSLAKASRSSTSARRSAVSASSRRTAKVRKTIGNSLSFLNQLNDNSTAEEQTCIEKYTQCMDDKISTIISKHSFLSDDEALNTALDTGQPFRCVYYDTNSNLLKSDTNLLNDDKSICINSDANNCYTQRGVNELYSSYNYYCDINRALKNNIGRKINQCNLSHANTFATKYSVAYYNEVLSRMNGDGLQMINLENSTIYKNFLTQLDLKNLDSYVLDPSISVEVFNELNLDQETELFSINVVPPVGANNYLAGSQFNTVSNSCFVVQDTTGMTTAQRKAAIERNQLTDYLKGNCSSLKSNLERYYLTGKWKGVQLDENGNQINSTAEDIQSDFFSAKDSCNLYEQALISVRDSKYGEFDNQMQNWIEDNIAKMIQKKIKSTSSLTQAETALKSLDDTISFDREKTAQEISFNKLKTESEIDVANTQYNIALQQAKTQTNIAQKDLAKTYVNNYSKAVLTKCSTMVKDSYDSVCGSNGSKCFSETTILTPYYTWISDISQRAIKISRNGNIIPSHTNNKATTGYDNYVITKENSSDKTKTEGYYPLYCVDVPSFNYKMSLFVSIIANVKALNTTVGENVEDNLKTNFPEKGE